MDISVSVLEFHTRKQYLSVKLVLVVKEVRVAGSHYGLSVLVAKCNYPAIKLAKPLIVRDLTLCNKKSVIADRLYFKIIVKVYNVLYFSFRFVIEYCAEKLTRLTRRADYKSLSMSDELCLGDPWKSAVILQIA